MKTHQYEIIRLLRENVHPFDDMKSRSSHDGLIESSARFEYLYDPIRHDAALLQVDRERRREYDLHLERAVTQQQIVRNMEIRVGIEARWRIRNRC